MSGPAGRPVHGVVATAHAQIRAGANNDAQRLLRHALQNGALGDPPNEDTVLALRLLGQATRLLGDLPGAAAGYEEARRQAHALGSPGLESAAVEGLALVARTDDEKLHALDLYDQAAQLADAAGDAPGYGAVLSNKGNLLLEMARYPEAEAVLREAMSCDGLETVQRAAMEDVLSGVLARMDRLDEAIEAARASAKAFEEAGAGIDRYVALNNLEGFQRRRGLDEEAAETFADAHELIMELEQKNLDREHYLHYPERRQAIEEETVQRLSAGGADPTFEIGLRTTRGDELAERGDLHFEASEYKEAEEALGEALEQWKHLGAVHEVPRIYVALGMLYTETGQTERALQYLMAGRQLAHQLGDAARELSACTNLCRFALDRSEDAGELNALQLIARARALHPIAVEQRLGVLPDGEDEPPVDGGVIDTLDTSICVEKRAWSLAEVPARRSLSLVETVLEGDEEKGRIFRYRLALRLLKLYVILRHREGKDQEAAEMKARLEEALDNDDSARTAYSVHATLGGERFVDDEWDETTFNHLTAACDAYERLRAEALRVGDLGDFAGTIQPPFDQAIEVAVKLGREAEALHLLERSKARSLLDALGQGESELTDATAAPLAIEGTPLATEPLAQPATADQLAQALGRRPDDPLLIELFVGPRNVLAFTLDGSGALAVHHLAEPGNAQWLALELLVHKNALAEGQTALEALRHPAIRELSRFIEKTAGDRDLFLCPHHFLHSLPLHLNAVGEEGGLAPRPGTYHLPSASLLRQEIDREQLDGALVAGDPQTNLPFASLEASSVGDHFGVEPALGEAATPEWLASHLAKGHAPLRLLHLACHAVFHPRRGERSGLVLSNGEMPAIVSVRDLAALDWNAGLVVLSACSSGQHEVRIGDELTGIARSVLGRGARALIVALWEVPDLATYLMVDNLYAELATEDEWDLNAIGDALASAQCAVRDTSARDLLAIAVGLHDRSAESDGDELLSCALVAAATAHRAAGNRDEMLRCFAAIKCLREHQEAGPDIGAFRWDRQPEIGAAAEYATAPFADPSNWAAFVLAGHG